MLHSHGNFCYSSFVYWCNSRVTDRSRWEGNNLHVSFKALQKSLKLHMLSGSLRTNLLLSMAFSSFKCFSQIKYSIFLTANNAFIISQWDGWSLRNAFSMCHADTHVALMASIVRELNMNERQAWIEMFLRIHMSLEILMNLYFLLYRSLDPFDVFPHHML